LFLSFSGLSDGEKKMKMKIGIVEDEDCWNLELARKRGRRDGEGKRQKRESVREFFFEFFVYVGTM